MHEISFEEAVRVICERNRRIDRDAYYFLREALEHTVAKIRAEETPEHQHVDGPELMSGFREYALEKFGPMAVTVLTTWGIKETDDVGRMVFDLIEQGVFGQSEEDKLEDFCGLYSFEEAFRAPFRPKGNRTLRKGRGDAGGGKPGPGSRGDSPDESAVEGPRDRDESGLL